MGNASSTKPNRRSLWSRLGAFVGLLLASVWAFGAMRGGGVNPFVTPPPRFAAAIEHPRAGNAALKGIFANVARARHKRDAEGEEASGSDLPWDQFLPRAAEIGDAQYAALYVDSWPSLFERRDWTPTPEGDRDGTGTFDVEPLLAAASLRAAGTASSGGGSTGGSFGGGGSGGQTSSGGARPDSGSTPPPGQVEIPAPVVPEPETWLVMIVGFATIGVTLRLRRMGNRAPTLH